ncbi:IS5 family transposase [Rhodococcus sp. T2V]|uniref:IS5 family transposase n=1 Tax=Rhodococcus sp. T2V TaxID=3034164 RepID=UPI0023E12D42|nr:IS5 family transposase [Rhodococcus sp. T2V]MDF3309644.1 IS5 family transposase [Rhodococcus sp. T2V]
MVLDAGDLYVVGAFGDKLDGHRVHGSRQLEGLVAELEAHGSVCLGEVVDRESDDLGRWLAEEQDQEPREERSASVMASLWSSSLCSIRAQRTGWRQHDGVVVARRKRRKPTPYPSDLSDAQWELIAPMVPAALPGGRPAIHDRRRIVEGILYVNRTGCSWWQLPHDFPPWQTVFGYFRRWNESGVTDRIHDALRAKLRDRSGRDPMASAGMVDAQAVKGADTVGADTRGWDGGNGSTAGSDTWSRTCWACWWSCW